MLLYIYGNSFPNNTYVIQCDPSYSVTRAKATFIHLANNIGIEVPHFFFFFFFFFFLTYHSLSIEIFRHSRLTLCTKGW
jgi:hypothetical protein